MYALCVRCGGGSGREANQQKGAVVANDFGGPRSKPFCGLVVGSCFGRSVGE
jgi:hypothetical protein